MRLRHEGLEEAPDIVTEGLPFYKDPAGYAMDRFNYFQCSRCKNPYFGGERQCGQVAPPHFDPSELVCGSCVAGDAGMECPKHGKVRASLSRSSPCLCPLTPRRRSTWSSSAASAAASRAGSVSARHTSASRFVWCFAAPRLLALVLHPMTD